MALVDAAAIGAQQAARNLDRFGCLQADDRLELAAQRAVGQVLEQSRGRGRVLAGAREDAAQVLDQVGAGPGGLFLLGQGDGFMRGAGQLGGVWGLRGERVRGCVRAGVVPDCRRDVGQPDAERARELVRPTFVELREVQCAVALGGARGEVGRLREVG